MKPYLLQHLICPVDKGSLQPVVFDQRENPLTSQVKDEIVARGLSVDDFKVEILDGVLMNNRLKLIYPIYHGVPRLLVFQHPLLGEFRQEFAKRLEELFQQGYNFPNDNSVPGEKKVLASFSNEWTGYGYNENAYWAQPADVYNSSLLSTLQNETQDLTNRLVLEVGIGSGGSADFMSKTFKCNLIGVDLGYAVDVAYKNFSSNPFFHIAQASAFRLPFRDETFDFVYSHGVLHHTYSTRTAFDSVARLPKHNGRFYIWVYCWSHELQDLKRSMIMGLEAVVRPWCCRLPTWMQTIVLQPIAPLYLFHQNVVYRGEKGLARYNWREAMHAARDRFTPRYIHRHNEEEVMGWFRENNYERIRPLSQRKLPDFGPASFFLNTGVEGFKRTSGRNPAGAA